MKNYINGMAIPSSMSLDDIVAETDGSIGNAISSDNAVFSKRDRNLFGRAFDYAASKVDKFVFSKAGAVISSVGLAALVITSSQSLLNAKEGDLCVPEIHEPTKCNNPGDEKGKCDNNVHYCQSFVTATTCGKDLELTWKTDAIGVNIFKTWKLPNESPQTIKYGVEVKARNWNRGDNHYPINYFLRDSDGNIVAEWPQEPIFAAATKSEEAKDIYICAGDINPKSIFNSRFSYSPLFTATQSTEKSRASMPVYDVLFKLGGPDSNLVMPAFFLYLEGNEDFSGVSSGAGIAIEERKQYRTTPLGVAIFAGYNSFDFPNGGVEFQLGCYGDERGNGDFYPVDDLQYRLNFGITGDKNKFSDDPKLWTVKGNVESLLDIGKVSNIGNVGTLYLLGFHFDFKLKFFDGDFKKYGESLFDGGRELWLNLGHKMRLEVMAFKDPLYDFKIDLKLTYLFATDSERKIHGGSLNLGFEW